ncbi:hypothetical protein QOZ80_5AG0406130 [Eleusine coracana subsp. coracana]|nr:hypothetical protein QOZ80_5AG0406130 [Eleusine coracana subsp. coracana]
MDVAASGMGSFDDQLELDVLGMSPAGSAVSAAGSEDEGDLRRGPWTMEEDVLLVNYIAKHGEGRWNSLARSAGLKRTGKSCRLRWLNYLRPDVRRGNITAEEQLLILELHSRWGNRWSKIAQHLPGRTDNEIKNYWRTRVQKHAKQLRCDVNSARFRDVVRYVWMPRLVERIHAESSSSSALALAAAGDDGRHDAPATVSAPAACQMTRNHDHHDMEYYCNEQGQKAAMSPDDTSSALRSTVTTEAASHAQHLASTPTNEGGVVQCSGGLTGGLVDGDDVVQEKDVFGGSWSELLLATTGRNESMIGLPDFELGDFEDNLWSLDDLCLHHQQWS